MKNKILSLLLIMTLLLIGQVQVVAADILSGEFKLTSNYYTDYENLETLAKLNLNFEQSNLTTGYHLDFDYIYDFKKIKGDLALNEAYFDYYGSNYDIRFGQQTVSWGKGLEYNPTDNLNPLNGMNSREDKEPILMLKGKYYIDYSYIIEGVLIPFHVPTTEEIIYNNMEFSSEPVEDDLSNMEYALRWSVRGVNGFDFSMSYFSGFEDLPTMGMRQTPMGLKPDPNNVYYREVDIYGADIATSYKGVGLWSEVALYNPKDGESYYSAVGGSDYNLSNGIYIEGQIIYLKDKLLNENIILQTAVENTFNNIHKFKLGSIYNFETAGYLIKPEVEFSLAEATLLKVSYDFYEGQLLNNDMLSDKTDNNRLNIELSYSF
ncbi:MAG: hypothetical protein KGY44_09825 [Halanaerobiales bacterium]|nr:hypothetical protein [Halanaerobiales bacterium]